MVRLLEARWMICTGCFLVGLTACSGGDSDVDQDTGSDTGSDTGTDAGAVDFDENALLENAANNVIVPAYEAFIASGNQVLTTLDTYITSLESGAATVAEDKAAVQGAWEAAMVLWQRTEVYQLGSAAELGEAPLTGAEGLRDEVYSWPLTNPCRVDQEVLKDEFNESDYFSTRLVNAYGMDALEYTLFVNSNGNDCPSVAEINSSGDWDSLEAVGNVVLQRARYAKAAMAEVVRVAMEIHDNWKADGGNFAGALANAGSGDSPFASSHDAVNDLYKALFYVEKRVKDYKLGRPAGKIECSSISCPQEVESLYARLSKEYIVENLKAVQILFLGSEPGSDGVGFDDYLRAADGGDALADVMTENLEVAIAAVEAIDGTLYDKSAEITAESCEDGTSSVCAAHAALKRFTDDFKTRFAEMLQLEIPQEAQGDND